MARILALAALCALQLQCCSSCYLDPRTKTCVDTIQACGAWSPTRPGGCTLMKWGFGCWCPLAKETVASQNVTTDIVVPNKMKQSQTLPTWLSAAGRGFLEGFLSSNPTGVDMCIKGTLGPISDIKAGMNDLKKGAQDRNLTEIEEGVASLRTLVKDDWPELMRVCKVAEADIEAIVKVLKGFHGLKDILAHIESDLGADDKGAIAQDLELMVRSFVEKQYKDFGNHLGKMLHRLMIGPEGIVVV